MQYTFSMAFFNSLFIYLKSLAASITVFVHLLATALVGPVVVTPPAAPASTNAPTHQATTTAKVATTTKAIVTKKAVDLPQTTVQNKPSMPAVTTPVVSTYLPVEQVNAAARQSLVNILCTTQSGGYFAPISGSGIVIDTRGVILTNAHVAQYFLLKDYPQPGNVQCVVRSGSPAQPLYTAELLYAPPTWVSANASQLTSDHALGTGEHDYAFLRITGTVSPSVPMPTSFTALSMAATPPNEGEQTLLAAYPAGLLDGETIQKNLYISSAVASVKQLYTFNDPSLVDLISVSGSVVSQTGSSGGGLVSLVNGKLLGMIATQTQGTTTADRNLNAITIGHINRSLAQNGKAGLVELLTGDLVQKSADFLANVAPGETAQLVAALKKTQN